MKKMMSLIVAVAIIGSSAVMAQWGAGWNIPAGADKEAIPGAVTAATLATGQGVYTANCAKCHGPAGLGDGPDSDPRNPAADLTDPFRGDLNPDGVVFYRVWNGKPPAMPTFSALITREQAWAVVAYVKTLRKAA